MKCIRQIYQKSNISWHFWTVQTVVVFLGETNISKLATAKFIFIRPPSLKVGSAIMM